MISRLPACNFESIVCNFEFIVCNLKSIVCNLESVVCNLESVVCYVDTMACNMENSCIRGIVFPNNIIKMEDTINAHYSELHIHYLISTLPSTLMWFFGFIGQFPEQEQVLVHETLFLKHPHRLVHFPSLQPQLFRLHGLEAPTTYACASPMLHFG